MFASVAIGKRPYLPPKADARSCRNIPFTGVRITSEWDLRAFPGWTTLAFTNSTLRRSKAIPSALHEDGGAHHHFVCVDNNNYIASLGYQHSRALPKPFDLLLSAAGCDGGICLRQPCGACHRGFGSLAGNLLPV